MTTANKNVLKNLFYREHDKGEYDKEYYDILKLSYLLILHFNQLFYNHFLTM